MNRYTFSKRFTLTIIGIITALILFVAVRQSSAQTPSAAQQLADAQAKIAQIGGYEFTSHTIEFTAANSRNVASRATEKHLHLEGTTNRQDDTFSLNVWDSAQVEYDADEALQLKAEDGKVFGRTSTTDSSATEWQQLEDMESMAASSDSFIYLEAAHHADFVDGNSQHIRFIIDGDKLSANMTAQMRAQLIASGQLPAGISFHQENTYADTITSGEIWLDANGLPAQLYVSIEWPTDGTTMLLQSNFHDYDTAGLLASFFSDPVGNLTASLQSITQSIDWATVATAGGTLLLMALAVLLLTKTRRGFAYSLFAVSMSLWMALTPLDSLARAAYAQDQRDHYPLMQQVEDEQALEFVSLRDGTAARNALVERYNTQNSNYVPVIDSSDEESFDTTRSPIALGEEESAVRNAASYLIGGGGSGGAGGGGGGRAASSTSTTTITDDDKDGLSYELETLWGLSDNDNDFDNDGLSDFEEVRRCPNRELPLDGSDPNYAPANDPINQNDPNCPNPKLADSDNDGINDVVEIRQLGTAVNNPDTDEDGIHDLQEVEGFLVAGVRRYSNPLDGDTDRDGLSDGDECPNMASNQSCQNTDGTDEPDIFDDDNDNDGVFNSVDDSPFKKLPASGHFDSSNQYDLSINNFGSDAKMLVDVMVSPTESRHLGYLDQTIDWPSGDAAGQIQRRFDTTFPGMGGDVRAIPMLEMRFDPNSAPLPRVPAATGPLPMRSFRVLGEVQLLDHEDGTNISQLNFDNDHVEFFMPTVQTSDSGSFDVSIFESSCGDYADPGNSAVAGVTGLNFSADRKGVEDVRLADFADGKHVIVLQEQGAPANEARCVAIEELAQGGTSLSHTFLRETDSLGTVAFDQRPNGTTRLLFDWSANGASLATDYAIHAGSCVDRSSGSPVTQGSLTPGQAAKSIGAIPLVTIADGEHYMTLDRNNEQVDCFTLPNLINGADNETEMIDLATLAQYGLVASEEGNEIIVSAPLQLQSEESTGRRAGFSAQLLLDPQPFNINPTRSVNGQLNMVWWIVALTDNCIDPPRDFMPTADADTRLREFCGEENIDVQQVVHKYDEEWLLGSVSVREDYGADVAIINENPATDDDTTLDGNLWQLAMRLDETFMAGVDCSTGNTVTVEGCTASDNKVDLQTTEIGSVVNAWGFAANTFDVGTEHLTSMLDVGRMPTEIISQTLAANFVNGTTVLAESPVLLIARSEKLRTVTLDSAEYATATATSSTFDFNPAGTDEMLVSTVHSMNWSPYQATVDGSTISWKSQEASSYLNDLEGRLLTDNSNAEINPLLQTVEAGRMIFVKLYFSYLVGGRSAQVSFGEGANEDALHDLNEGAVYTPIAAEYAARLAKANATVGTPEVPLDESATLIFDVADILAKGYATVLEGKLRRTVTDITREAQADSNKLPSSISALPESIEPVLIAEIYSIIGQEILQSNGSLLAEEESASTRSGAAAREDFTPDNYNLAPMLIDPYGDLSSLALALKLPAPPLQNIYSSSFSLIDNGYGPVPAPEAIRNQHLRQQCHHESSMKFCLLIPFTATSA